MTNPNKVITTTIDEIVEALSKALAPILGLTDEEEQLIRTALEGLVSKDAPTPTEKLPDANPHHCPQCSWQCSCSDQPCSCCTTPTEKGGEDE